jgi:hypothetical protein
MLVCRAPGVPAFFRTGLTWSEPCWAHYWLMRLFWIALVIVALVAIDHAYLDGQNSDQVMSLVRWAGTNVSDWAHDLLRPLRR